MAHTAKEVLALANKMLDWSSVDDEAYADEQSAHAMLRAYAEQLEQDEQRIRGQYTPATMDEMQTAPIGRYVIMDKYGPCRLMLVRETPKNFMDEMQCALRPDGLEVCDIRLSLTFTRPLTALRETTPTP